MASASGVKGVYRLDNGKWHCKMHDGFKMHSLGTFPAGDLDLAKALMEEARQAPLGQWNKLAAKYKKLGVERAKGKAVAAAEEAISPEPVPSGRGDVEVQPVAVDTRVEVTGDEELLVGLLREALRAEVAAKEAREREHELASQANICWRDFNAELRRQSPGAMWKVGAEAS